MTREIVAPPVIFVDMLTSGGALAFGALALFTTPLFVEAGAAAFCAGPVNVEGPELFPAGAAAGLLGSPAVCVGVAWGVDGVETAGVETVGVETTGVETCGTDGAETSGVAFTSMTGVETVGAADGVTTAGVDAVGVTF